MKRTIKAKKLTPRQHQLPLGRLYAVVVIPVTMTANPRKYDRDKQPIQFSYFSAQRIYHLKTSERTVVLKSAVFSND